MTGTGPRGEIKRKDGGTDSSEKEGGTSFGVDESEPERGTSFGTDGRGERKGHIIRCRWK